MSLLFVATGVIAFPCLVWIAERYSILAAGAIVLVVAALL